MMDPAAAFVGELTRHKRAQGAYICALTVRSGAAAWKMRAGLFALALLVGEGQGHAAPDQGVAFFEKNIRPVLAEHCYECHSTRAKKKKGGLLLDSRAGWQAGGESGPEIVPGDPEASRLIKAVRYLDPDLQMPPETKLPAETIVLLERWVKMGAPDPRDA